MPGGYGIKLRYSDPMLLDDVAADFPELTIVMAHPAVPWVDAQIAIALHQSQLLYRPVRLVTEIFSATACSGHGRQLRSKALFGTDHPYITLDRWRRDFDTDIDPQVLPMILEGQRFTGTRHHRTIAEAQPRRYLVGGRACGDDRSGLCAVC